MINTTPVLRVQIAQIDYTYARSSILDYTKAPKAPIIRIYGASSLGLKTCLHVHQVYPYFFVEYLGQLNPNHISHYIAKLTHSLNHAIAVSLKRDPRSPNSQFVRAIILVKGVHFYGFHSSYSPFLKVYIMDPAFVNRSATILRSGIVMGTRFRVFESHLSYVLQFLCDFSLYGCGWIDLGEVWQRGADEQEIAGLDPQSKFKSSPCFQQSRMSLEVDVVPGQILNRHLLGARNLHHKLTIPGPRLPSEPLVLSVRELWEDERQRRIVAGLSPSPDIPIDPSEKSRTAGGEWAAEARWWDEIRMRIERERHQDAQPKEISWERWTMTTFESVEALWEDGYKTWRPARTEGQILLEEYNPYEGSVAGTRSSGAESQDGTAEIDVDETILRSQELSILVEHEEAEWTKLIDGDRIVSTNDMDQNLPDDGLPFDLQPDDHAASSPTTPVRDKESRDTKKPSSSHTTPFNTALKKLNPFREAFSKLAGSRTVASNALSMTPTKCGLSASHLPPTLPTTSFEEQDEFQPSLETMKRPLFEPSHINEGVGFAISNTTSRVHSTGSHSASPHDCDHHDVNNSERHSGELPMFVPKNDNAKSLAVENFAAIRHRIVHFDSSSRQASPSLRRTRYRLHSQPSQPSSFLIKAANAYIYIRAPPPLFQLFSTINDYGIPSKIYRNPYYSKMIDATDRPREYAGLVYHLHGGNGLKFSKEWGLDSDAWVKGDSNRVSPWVLTDVELGGWEYGHSPPSVREVNRWVKTQGKVGHAVKSKLNSQIEGPTQPNPFGLKTSPTDRQSTTTGREKQSMTILSLEIFAPSRENLLPNADIDEIAIAFYAYEDSDDGSHPDRTSACKKGVIAVQSAQLDPRKLRDFSLELVSTELDLINKAIDTVLDFDPDIIAGWEIQAASWGYINARARHFGFDLGEQISRAPSRTFGTGNEQWGLRTTSTFRVVGRHVFNVWRIMRAEQSLNIYTFENTAFHLLRRRVPKYSSTTLTKWYNSGTPTHTASLLRYFVQRSSMVLDMLDEAETITKTAEFARVFGVDFFSVISRGSQFKVESFMFRIAKPESFVLLSPSKQDVGKQNAAECMPLIMEPLSAFYNSPLVVLDFQSLYPSVMIAYNYCYSTCLGRVVPFKGQNKFGVTELTHPPGLLNALQDYITVAPNGMMYVKSQVRRGLLSRMLSELLETRVMVKQAMKGVKGNKALKKILDARQLGLKYISNVTYGYTSATYSGRMPAVEIADSIVQTGRETLEKAITYIESTSKWGARVVYGDTDSLFIYLSGKTKDQAFRIGHDIAETITAMNPAPIKLKFEKVYLPCVLMAKKRYVGFKYETPDDTEPAFDAKGIETVRRDGVSAQRKMTETALKILFRSQDLSEVKEYCCRSWSKILENKISIQDFIFAREVKMGTYSDKAPPQPGVAVGAQRTVEDSNDEPQYGDRIPYVIIRGEPNARLVDRAVSPEKALDARNLDGAYYITRVLIPPLERIFNLVGADVRAWYDEMPKKTRANEIEAVPNSPRKFTNKTILPNIGEHFRSNQCIICGTYTAQGVCEGCRRTPQETVSGLLSRLRIAEERLKTGYQICASCTESVPSEPIRCESLDCPWFFERKKAEVKAENAILIHTLLDGMEVGE